MFPAHTALTDRRQQRPPACRLALARRDGNMKGSPSRKLPATSPPWQPITYHDQTLDRARTGAHGSLAHTSARLRCSSQWLHRKSKHPASNVQDRTSNNRTTNIRQSVAVPGRSFDTWFLILFSHYRPSTLDYLLPAGCSMCLTAEFPRAWAPHSLKAEDQWISYQAQ